MTGVQTESGVLAGDERMLIDGELQITKQQSDNRRRPSGNRAGGRSGD
jgi:hypothetical protein